eukprot:Phypoly_transcript_09501.p1 GENE.Phypoly_transcript_09501~~Phypoly_transcript_09501.p1  ORF type:complete len:385 (+),score=64.77 Phypoly_transcript_09501:91-1245(+)
MVLSTASKITDTLNSFTSKPNGIPGAVFRVVKKDGTILYDGASGVRGIDHKDEPMTTDTVFWIASFTKLITAVAALQLVEHGKIAVDDQVSKYLPEIEKIQILTGFDAEDKPILQDPKTKITIRHLLTHTSGTNYVSFNPRTKKYADMNNIPKLSAGDARSLYGPLSFEPGTSWEYGTGIDWVGLVIEKVTGQKLGAYMQQHIFDPLGIHSTSFEFLAEHSARRARMHLRAPDQSLSEMAPNAGYSEKVEHHLGGGGLHSIASDYTAVLIALLNDGQGATAKSILKKESVAVLFKDQEINLGKLTIVPPHLQGKWTFGGMALNSDVPSGRTAGSVWWAGAASCFWWLDFSKEIAGVLLTQILPPGDTEAFNCLSACEQLVYAGL